MRIAGFVDDAEVAAVALGEDKAMLLDGDGEGLTAVGSLPQLGQFRLD